MRGVPPLGFNNKYVLGMRRYRAGSSGSRGCPSSLGIRACAWVSAASSWSELTAGPGLRKRYQLSHEDVRGLNHDLAYRALADDSIDITDLYSTDAEIVQYDLIALVDDAHYFPAYQALFVCRDDVEPRVLAIFDRLGGRIDERAMTRMNARAKLDREPETQIAADFLREQFGVDSHPHERSRGERIWQRTREHLAMVAISLGAAILLAIPLGVLAFYRRGIGRVVFAVADVLQTLPALALLVFLIPWLGIGYAPAIFALFLYSVLPILRNTHAGLADIPQELRESAAALGLTRGARLRHVEFRLAARSISPY